MTSVSPALGLGSPARASSPLVRVLAVYLAVVLALGGASLALTRGVLVFPLDDAYIHFSIARTLAESGTYGLQPGAFATPASSLVWPLLLALGNVVGLRVEWVALVLAVASGAWALVVVDGELARSGASARRRAVSSIAVGALVPIVPMALLAMEHALHVAAVIALVAAVARADETPSRATVIRATALAALAAAVRYETAFVVAPLAAWVVVSHRRHGLALGAGLAIGAALPVAAAGAFFVSRGSPFFPASVVLKRAALSWDTLGPLLVTRAREHPHVPALLVGIAIAWRSARSARCWLLVGAVALVAQSVFAQLGWFYRYESYAVALALVGLAIWAPAASRRELAVVALLLAPLGLRAVYAHGALPRASRNVYEQQWQMARLVRQVAPSGAVAVNDVGAVSYLGGAKVLDLMGLADLRVARERRMRIDGPLAEGAIDRLSREDGVALAILYEGWFAGALPAAWVPVERWRIRDNRVCAFDTVTIYAPDAARAAPLRRALDAFRPELPSRVAAVPIGLPPFSN